jgi:hypothetical protein
MAARIAIIAMTTNSLMSVKPRMPSRNLSFIRSSRIRFGQYRVNGELSNTISLPTRW